MKWRHHSCSTLVYADAEYVEDDINVLPVSTSGMRDPGKPMMLTANRIRKDAGRGHSRTRLSSREPGAAYSAAQCGTQIDNANFTNF